MKLKQLKDMTLTQIWDKMKKPFNFTWRTGVIIISIGMVYGLVCELGEWVWDLFDDGCYETEYISNHVKVRYYSDGTCRLYERYNDKKLSRKLKFVDYCPMTDDTLTSYQTLEGKWGFIGIGTGKVAIPAAYTKVWDFCEGLAAVSDGSNRVGFIDRKGDLVIPMQDVDHIPGYYSFGNGIAILESPETGLKGAINKEGKWVIPMVYKNIFYPDDSGFMKVYDGCHWGLYDSEGKEIFPIEYDQIYYDSCQEGVFALKDGVKQLLSLSGEVIESFIVDHTHPLRYIVEYNPESESEYVTHPFLVDYCVDDFHGVLDSRTGRIVIPAIYDRIEMASRDMITASIGIENIESVAFDLKGRKIE